MNSGKQRSAVFYLSQYSDITSEYWRSRACGVTCLKMLVHYVGTAHDVTLDDFLKHGVSVGAYGEHGWTHRGLAHLAKQYDVEVVPKEWRVVNKKSIEYSQLREEGIRTLIAEMKEGRPALASVAKKFRYPRKYHIVLLIDIVRDDKGHVVGFCYHDPGYSDVKNGANKVVSLADFRRYWRRMAILLGRNGATH